jgi:hypothetical protein
VNETKENLLYVPKLCVCVFYDVKSICWPINLCFAITKFYFCLVGGVKDGSFFVMIPIFIFSNKYTHTKTYTI